MANWRSGFVEVNGLRLHYRRRRNKNRPALVLAHGFSDDGLCWRPVADRLMDEYELILVDARGHGRSAEPGQSYNAVTAAADLAGVITALRLAHPAVLGHSMGAVTALALAGTYPELVRAILLEDPPPWWQSDALEADPAWLAGMRQWLTGLKRLTRAELIAAQRQAAPTWSTAELGPWADAKLRASFNILNQSPSGLDWPATLRAITCPTLLITAAPELGALVTPAAVAAFCQLLPAARVVHLPGAGHSIRREQFEPYLAAVRAFLAETMG